MKLKKVQWKIDMAPAPFEPFYDKIAEIIVNSYLYKCDTKPTIKSAFRYAQKIADASNCSMMICTWKKWRNNREKDKVMNFFVVYPNRYK